MRGYLGVDVGSVSTNLLTTDEQGNIIASLYIRTQGQPIAAIQEGLALLKKELPPDFQVCGAGGATGSGRTLAGVIVGADLVKRNHCPCDSSFTLGTQCSNGTGSGRPGF